MSFSHLHYLPLALPFFSILVALFLVLVALLQIGVLRYAYLRLGISSGAALLLLLGSLIGSYFNIPVAELSGHQIAAGREITFYGMRYVVPILVESPGTVIAVNVGGALIPGAMSLYLLARHRLWARGAIATLCVAILCHLLADPIPGLGIALPVFVPALAAAVVALLLSPRRSPTSRAASALSSAPTCSIWERFRDWGRPWPRSAVPARSTASSWSACWPCSSPA